MTNANNSEAKRAVRQALLDLSVHEASFSKDRLREAARHVLYGHGGSPRARAYGHGEFSRALGKKLVKWERSGIIVRWTTDTGIEMIRVHDRDRLLDG